MQQLWIKKNSKTPQRPLTPKSATFTLTDAFRLTTMNRTKKLAKWGLAILALFTLALTGISLLLEEQIVRQLLAQLNEELEQPIKVESASLSLIRDFPNASVSLVQVRLNDLSDSLLLKAGRVQFSFGVLDLINNAVVFDAILVQDGELHLHIDKHGVPNYQILKPAGFERENNSTIILQEALLSDVQITYTNNQLSQHFSQNVKKAKFSGSFAERAFALRSNAVCFSDSIRLNENTFLKNLEWGYQADLYVDKINHNFELRTASLNIEESEFACSGTVRSNDSGQVYDLNISGSDFDPGTVLEALSGAIPYDIGDLYCEGNLHLNARIKGEYSKDHFPEINGNIELERGELDHPDLYYPIEDATLTASFTNSAVNATGPTVFEISRLKGYVDKMPVEVFFRMENIENPYLDIVADGELPLREIIRFVEYLPIEGPEGHLIFRTVKLSGLASQITDPGNWGKVVMKGELECKDLAFQYNGTPVSIAAGFFKFDDAKAELKNLQVTLEDSDIQISGTANDLLPVVFAGLSNSESNTAAIEFNILLESEYMDVKNVMNTILSNHNATARKEVNSNTTEAQTIVDIGYNLNGTFGARLDKFTFGKFEGKHFKGSLRIGNNVLKVKGRADAMNGHCQMESTIRLQREPTISAQVLFENTDIKKLFEQGNDLGQGFVRSEHLDGTMNAGALIYGHWDSLLRFDNNSLHILAGVKIEDGYLRNFDLLESFSDYVENDDLRKVKFATLYNWLEYRENTFILPAMFVQNNAMNLTVCGTQTFDGRIDYNFKINGSQVLEKKLAARKFKGKLIPAKKDGFFNLYINLHGTVNNFDYSLSKGKVKTALRKSEDNRRRIKRIIFDAFGKDASAFTIGDEMASFETQDDFSEEDGTEYIEGF